MTTKKKSTGAIPPSPSAEPEFVPEAQTACGHINKQFVNSRGEREDLACTLLPGHDGDHYARFNRLATDYGIKKDERGSQRPGPVGEHVEEADGWWSDAAGEFPKAAVVTPEDDFKRLQATRARERGVDPGLSAQLDGEVRKTFNA